MTKLPYRGRGQVGSYKTHPPIAWAAVVPLYRQGLLAKEIAGSLSCSAEHVRRALEFWCEPRRPRGQGAVPPEKNRFWRGGAAQGYQSQRYWAGRIAETCLGRQLQRGEVVHHVDENPQNNDPSNLIVFPSNGPHLRAHWLLLQSPPPVTRETAIRVALENGGQALRRPASLVGWSLDTVPPVPPDGLARKWPGRTRSQPAPRATRLAASHPALGSPPKNSRTRRWRP